MRVILSVLSLFIFLQSPLFAQEKLSLAVLSFEAKGVSEEEATVVTDVIRGTLVKTNKYVILDRENVAKILAEQSFQQTSHTDTDRAVKMGKLLNVRYIVTGTLSRLGGNFVLSVNMINIESAEIVKSEFAKAPSIENMFETSQNLALLLVGLEPIHPQTEYATPSYNIGGSYSVYGKNPNGSSYKGRVQINRQGDVYFYTWNIGKRVYHGQGRIKGSTITVDWGDTSPVIYTIRNNGVLDGVWSNGTASETLVPKR